uniref:CARD domain-containing protein n=1 Tax=Amphilophus citrinellus TaxID=61819 RepID=A0A3Q0RG57_AMPCI
MKHGIELKNLSVILDNLIQKEVLSKDEVNIIQTEKTDEDKKRMMLDSVRKKGEAACYELLKIIYMTRKRTLGRLPLEAFTETKNDCLFITICD